MWVVQVEAETPDAWLGLLREPKTAGQPLPPTLRAIVVEQFHRSFFGPGGLYWRDDTDALGNFLEEVEESTYARIIAANTDADVSGNVFIVENWESEDSEGDSDPEGRR